VEGPTDDPNIERMRNRQVKNFLTATLLSIGVPMIYMGDEVRRTQRGNNNDYCHDDESNWLESTRTCTGRLAAQRPASAADRAARAPAPQP